MTPAADTLEIAVTALPLLWTAEHPARRRLWRLRRRPSTRPTPATLARDLTAWARDLLIDQPGRLPALTLGAVAGLVVAMVFTAPFAIALGPVVALWLRHRARRAAHRALITRRRAAVGELCSVLRAELRAGRDVPEALVEAWRSAPELRGALPSTLRFGTDPAGLLRRAAAVPGFEDLAAVAVCVQVAAATGAGLVRAVGRLELALRTQIHDRAEIAAELSGVRMTATLLAGLPVLGIGLGGLSGADPLRILLGTPLGALCVLVGAALEIAGVLWVDRITQRAEAAV